MKLHEYIEKNIDVFKTMVKSGVIPCTTMNYFQIYQVYKGSEKMRSKMSRYYFTSDVVKTSTLTVMKAVKFMESNVK